MKHPFGTCAHAIHSENQLEIFVVVSNAKYELFYKISVLLYFTVSIPKQTPDVTHRRHTAM